MKWSGFSNKWVLFFLHFLLWILLFSLPILLRPSEGQMVQSRQETGSPERLYHNIVSWASWILLFYVNTYLLIPRFLNAKRYLQYVLSVLSVFALLHFINRLSLQIFLPAHISTIGAYVFFFLFPTLIFLSISTVLTVIRDKVREFNRVQARESEHLKTELAFLRSQVSPHFMFNVLNSMVVLARKKSEELEPSIFKLSTLMRYMLYETDEKKVSLEKEIEYIQGYSDLQLQRFGNRVCMHADMQKPDRAYLIEPMLLIPFVENAFKHGTGWKDKSEIGIFLQAESGLLIFEVSNYFEKTAVLEKDDTQGIGLQNVKKRLDLLYGKKHQLRIKTAENRFIVHLELKLD